MKEDNCSVYVIKSREFFKVGVTRNFKKRFEHFLTSNPFELEKIIEVNFESSEIARMAESFAHSKLKALGFHHRGEWFHGDSPDILISIVMDSCKQAMSLNNKLKKNIKKRIDRKEHRRCKGFVELINIEHHILIKNLVSSSSAMDAINTFGVRRLSKISGVNMSRLSDIRSGNYIMVSADNVKKASSVLRGEYAIR